MELWIRSQDRETLMIASHLDIYNLGTGTPEYYIEECGVTMGCYKDKERALEVLDEIQGILKPRIITKFRNELKYDEDKELNTTYIPFDTFENTEIQELTNYVYEMPEE